MKLAKERSRSTGQLDHEGTKTHASVKEEQDSMLADQAANYPPSLLDFLIPLGRFTFADSHSNTLLWNEFDQ